MRGAFHDESGVALGLAIIVVVVIGVMGAGLLVFARNDLASVIRVNQGQRAFYAADAGVQTAKRQLLSDALPSSYDVDDAGSEFYGGAECNVPDEARDSDWSLQKGGAEREFDGGEFVATIRWLSDACGSPAGGDPDAEYFEVVSTGTSGEAKRRIEAVYATSDVDAPLANYAAENVDIGGTASIDGVSVFASGDVEAQAGAAFADTEDLAYGDWAKADGVGRSTDLAGVGAAGQIEGVETGTGRHLDSDTIPAFVAEEPGEGEITFPFASDYFGGDSVLDFLKEEAVSQGNYEESAVGFSWPEDSSNNTVVYVDFGESGGTLDLSSTVCGDSSECRGTLVVENGSFSMEGGSVFSGAVVVAGGENPESLSAAVEEGALLEGFVSSSGNLEIAGDVSSLTLDGALLRPGYHGVELWSWRELYE